MSKRVSMFPLWLRAWHWLNAVCFLLLAASGFSMHFAGTGAPPLSFRRAVAIHNGCAALILANLGFYALAMLRTGHWRQYVPSPRGLVGRLLTQVRYYVHGIFLGAHHPFAATPERRFNPIQQLVYLLHMFLLFPLLAASGILLLFPGAAPAQVIHLSGILPAAILHTLLAYGFLCFLAVHLYLAFTAGEPHTGVLAMLLGDRPGTPLPANSRREDAPAPVAATLSAPDAGEAPLPVKPAAAKPAGAQVRSRKKG